MSGALNKELYTLDDELNPLKSKTNTIYPKSIIDNIFDPLTSNNKSLRVILAEMRNDFLTGEIGNIAFPVTSVNGKSGDLIIDKSDIGLDKVNNTSDDEKELSVPQKAAVMELISNYDFNIDQSQLIGHINDTNNPHGVNVSSINETGELTQFVQDLIQLHDINANSHNLIQTRINTLSNSISEANNNNRALIQLAMDTLSSHSADESAHSNLFGLKENLSNKVNRINEGSIEQYPTTLAVTNYVDSRLNSFHHDLDVPNKWISDIEVIDTYDDLPNPSMELNHMLYIIRKGNNGHEEAYICVKSGNRYFWQGHELGSYTRFNSSHFVHEFGEMSLNVDELSYILLSEGVINRRLGEVVEEKLPSHMTNYVTVDDLGGVIKKITFTRGTMDGTIKFYYNDDQSTMSDDIPVAGLQRLAYLEKVTGNEIEQESVDGEHIKNRAIINRHLDDQCVEVRNLNASWETILGNLDDMTSYKVQEIPISYLAKKLAPYIATEISLPSFSEQIENLVKRYIEEILVDMGGTGGSGIVIPGGGTSSGTILSDEHPVSAWMIGGYVGIDSTEPLPRISVDDTGDMYMTPNGTNVSNYLENTRFTLDDSDDGDGIVYFDDDNIE